MTLKRVFPAAAMLALVSLSHQAQASLMLDASYNNGFDGESISISHNGVSSRPGVGLLTFDLAQNTPTDSLPFMLNGLTIETFCVEFTQGVINGWQSYSLVETSQVFSSVQSEAIERLYTAYHGQVGSSANNAAFQLALWEVVHETHASSWDLTTGNFQATSNVSIVNMANSWLSSLDSIESQFSLYVLTNSSSQNQLVFSGVPLDTPPSVPAPATLGLFGLGALLLLRRRN